MQILKETNALLYRIFRLETGEFIRVTFIVSECAGNCRARIIHVENLGLYSFYEKKACRAFPILKTIDYDNYENESRLKPVLTPYFELNYFISQLTRAPSVK